MDKAKGGRFESGKQGWGGGGEGLGEAGEWRQVYLNNLKII